MPRVSLAQIAGEPGLACHLSAEEATGVLAETIALALRIAARLGVTSEPSRPSEPPEACDRPNNWLTVAEVAKRLGVHEKTVRRYICKCGLPVHRLPGGDLRLLWPDVSRWMAQRREARK